MNGATGHDVVVVGAGILGLASAYHILQAGRGLDLLVLDRLPGGGLAVDREGGYRKITGALVGTHPFGGFKMSGTNAKAGGPDYLRLFLEMKSVAEPL